MNRKQHLEIDFEPGIRDEFPDFMDCVRESVYGCGRAFKAIAGDLDMSSSDLSRRLASNPGDTAYFHLRHLVPLMHATGDIRPIYWLVDDLIIDHGIRQKQARDELAELMPRIARLLEAADESSQRMPHVTDINRRSA